VIVIEGRLAGRMVSIGAVFTVTAGSSATSSAPPTPPPASPRPVIGRFVCLRGGGSLVIAGRERLDEAGVHVLAPRFSLGAIFVGTLQGSGRTAATRGW
jgi:hypothetical protein